MRNIDNWETWTTVKPFRYLPTVLLKWSFHTGVRYLSTCRNHCNDIYGIWFYDKKDCEAVGGKVEELVQEVEARQQARKAASGGGGGGGGGADLNHILQVSHLFILKSLPEKSNFWMPVPLWRYRVPYFT